MDLLGPDGKEMSAPQAPSSPAQRHMPSRQEKFNLVFMMFTLMTTAERQQLVKALRPLRRKLDVLYPNGMSEGDIKNDLEKAANAVVPDEQGNAVPQTAEVGAEQSVPVEPKSDAHVEESGEGC